MKLNQMIITRWIEINLQNTFNMCLEKRVFIELVGVQMLFSYKCPGAGLSQILVHCLKLPTELVVLARQGLYKQFSMCYAFRTFAV